MSIVKHHFAHKFKNAYWARFFKKTEGGYFVDIPDMPGCATCGSNLEEAYKRLIGEAIPLWLEDQPWPAARTADDVMILPFDGQAQPSVLVRVTIDEVGGSPLSALSIRSIDLDHERQKYN